MQTSQSQFHNFCLCSQTNLFSTLFEHIAPCACIQSVQTNQSCFSTLLSERSVWAEYSLHCCAPTWAFSLSNSFSIEHSALCVLHLCELSVCANQPIAAQHYVTMKQCNVDTVEVRKSPQWKSLQWVLWVLCAQHRFSGAAQYLRFTGSEGAAPYLRILSLALHSVYRSSSTIFASPITCTASCIYAIYAIYAQLGVAQYLRIISFALWHPVYRIYTQDEISNIVQMQTL